MNPASTVRADELMRLRKGVHAATDETGRTHLIRWPDTTTVGQLTESGRAALHLLARETSTEAELRRRTGADPEFVTGLVSRLLAGGWLEITVMAGDSPLYTLEPLREPTNDRSMAVAPPAAKLSSMATLSPLDGQLVLGVPGADCDVRLVDPRVLPAVHLLVAGAAPAQLSSVAELDRETVARLLADLSYAGVLDQTEGTNERRTRQWSPHEIWFHAGSRLGDRRRLGENIGKTGRFDNSPDQPASSPGISANSTPISLYRPDLDVLRETDPPLTVVLEDRVSSREYDEDHPLTDHQLGEFLYRCTSVREKVSESGLEFLGRPYPSGGASFELEFYPLVHRVTGLEPGLYRYDQHDHRLWPLAAEPAALRRMAGVIQTLQAIPAPPQVQFVVTARFGRVMGKYEAMAYALTLKHVGVVFQVMYLVATAMGLSACAIGTGESEQFCAAIGADYFTESPVGEFMLGSRPDPGWVSG